MAFADAVELRGCISWSSGALVGLHALHYLLLAKGAWPSVTKPIMVGKAPCKFLCAFEVLVGESDSFTDFLASELLVNCSY